MPKRCGTSHSPGAASTANATARAASQEGGSAPWRGRLRHALASAPLRRAGRPQHQREEGTLRFYDPVTGQKLLSHTEIEQAQREAEERAGREEAARQAAEARIAELEARLRERDRT
jgi:hypothetical protein